MPMYEHRCGYCGAHRDVFIKIADLDLEIIRCLRCSQPMARCLAAPAVVGDYAPYECPITGKVIEGRRAHTENLAKHGCRIREEGETREFIERRRVSDQALERKVEDTVEAEIHNMDTRKREQLISEVQAGADVVYHRDSKSTQ